MRIGREKGGQLGSYCSNSWERGQWLDQVVAMVVGRSGWIRELVRTQNQCDWLLDQSYFRLRVRGS